MITDQRQTGVPTSTPFKIQGINQRTQLVKPNQVNNIGRAMPQNQNLAGKAPVPQSNPSFKIRQATNPVASTPMVSEAPTTMAGATLEPSLNPTQETPVVSANETVAPVAQQATAPVTESDIDIARSAIQRMSDTDILTILNELGTGTLKGRGTV